MATVEPSELVVRSQGATLAGEQSGRGPAIVLLHGLSATRRYVVMGSRSLERSGHRVIAYDARGHGRSSPASDGRYDYQHLALDLEAVLDAAEVEQAVLAGASMGAHTAVRFTLAHPERVLGLAIITPAFEPDQPLTEQELARWDALARGLREGGVEGFVAAYELERVPEVWRKTTETVLRQRLGAHEHPEAVADALEALPRSRPFEDIAELGEIAIPTLVVASRDGADPGHPLAVGVRYAASIPGARLIVEDAGPPVRSPIAWQGGQLSRVLSELVAESTAISGM
ncbi:MAG TPA: alpha/beta hydrolase [Solirubrobacteraceae bacterium]|jgi:pimeloyl-ACP methyl ester carboxylesterase|nr:alpha/beta hydrolase [Solirubrobacteraceae bacterium]